MSKLSRQEVSFWILVCALVANAWIHYRSPAYRFYRSHASELDNRVTAFEDRVKDEFVPALRDIATNAVSVSSSASPPCFQSSAISTSETSVGVSVEDYRFQHARGGGLEISGCYINGHFYRLGDLFFGSPIIDIEPSCAITRDFVIRASKIRSGAPEKGS